MQNGCRRRRKEEGKKRKNKKEDGNKNVRSRREGENIKGTRAWNPGDDDETGACEYSPGVILPALLWYFRHSSGVPFVFPEFFRCFRHSSDFLFSVFGIPLVFPTSASTLFCVILPAFLQSAISGNVPASLRYFRQPFGFYSVFFGIPSAFIRPFSAFFLPSRCAPVFPRRRSKISIHRRRFFAWPLSS